jgi:hypothetical protein
VEEEEVRGELELVGEPEEERDQMGSVRVGELEWEGVTREEGEEVLDRVVDTVLVTRRGVADTVAEVVLDWVRLLVALWVGDTEEEPVKDGEPDTDRDTRPLEDTEDDPRRVEVRLRDVDTVSVGVPETHTEVLVVGRALEGVTVMEKVRSEDVEGDTEVVLPWEGEGG